ncbi:unnamed protein product [Notodromas monacha]|uniref:Uncharacterized protein n=1 Tax=Notodromas monacha TaxID=399045 RepID=A0A7R9C0Z9_9CRUS|nr:unnamed protein product [Notodromas monacha]CAG0924143.1 unnamed protein product [Notodromas monacha]
MLNKIWSVLCVIVGIAHVGIALLINSDIPGSLEKYQCDGIDTASSKVVVDVKCPDTDSLFVGEQQIEGCKMRAGDVLVINLRLTPSESFEVLNQAATTKLGTRPVGLAGGLPKVACSGTPDAPCASPGIPFEHTARLELPPLIPIHLKGNLARYFLKDNTTGRYLFCMDLPVFIPASVAKRIKKA